MVCHNTAGSLLLSATGVLPHRHRGLIPVVLSSYDTVALGRSTVGAAIWPAAAAQKTFCVACKRSIECPPNPLVRKPQVNLSAHQPAQLARAAGLDIRDEPLGQPSAEPTLR